jgi:hypothetical protein
MPDTDKEPDRPSVLAPTDGQPKGAMYNPIGNIQIVGAIIAGLVLLILAGLLFLIPR